jgi:threonine dehydrogenase-like Zn-dependent dehydrogenase
MPNTSETGAVTAPPTGQSTARSTVQRRASLPTLRRLRAVRVLGPGRIEVADLPLPAPDAGTVRVAIEGCGVCASNLEPWAGPDWMQFPTAPGALGHEGWGRIDALGAGVGGLRVGQRVAFLGDASYASHEVVPAHLVAPLPSALDGRPVPGEALGCALNIFRRCRVRAGDRVAIVGIGFLGAILTQLATGVGAEIIAVSRREEARALAARKGAAHALPFDGGTVAAVAARSGGAMCDVVIEAVGRQEALDLASALVGTGGRLVIAGYHQDGPRQVDMQGWNWRGIDVVNAHERDDDRRMAGLRAGVAALATGRIDLRGVLTHAFPLDRLDAALDAARDRPAGFVKGWVRCDVES